MPTTLMRPAPRRPLSNETLHRAAQTVADSNSVVETVTELLLMLGLVVRVEPDPGAEPGAHCAARVGVVAAWALSTSA